MDTNLLKEIGMTEGEVKVYFALLKLGSTKTGKLAVNAEVSSSKVYKILDRLEKKGLVGHILKGKIKYFSATNPNRILDYIDDKEKKLLRTKKQIASIIPELEKQQSLGKETRATVYTGFKGVTNFFRNILNDLKKGETYYVIVGGYGENVPGLSEFYRVHHTKRANRKIKVQMLANHNYKDKLDKTTYLNSKIKFLPEYLNTNMKIVFYQNKTFIAILTSEPTGILIESEETAKSFQTYFNALWKIAT